MLKFQDPGVLFQDFLVMVKVWHVFDGIFIWEFFTTLDFEWNVIRGHRPYRWTIWIYSLTRISTLLVVILNMIALGYDASIKIHCQLLVTFQLILAYLANACARLLIVLRVIAIWNRNKFILASAYTTWGINVAFLIQGIVRLRAEPTLGPGAFYCAASNSDSTELNVIAMFVTDIILLLMMFAGLLRHRRQAGGMLELGNFLWKQGIIWISFAVVSGFPTVVFLVLNLNEAFNVMFQIPALITLTIAATQIYRSLLHFSTDDVSSSGVPNGGLAFAKAKGVSDSRWDVPPSQIHMAVHDTPEHSQLPQLMSQVRVSMGTREQLQPLPITVKVHELGPEEDVNVSVEKIIVDTTVS